ncbi:MAG TPA: carboxypeptidase regulatory-like domain-containing protein [Longimicrobiales bacterium]|nr:carboxypeptidase regulatory-like domain-containing protein [Longimicrobiales bacterium]
MIYATVVMLLLALAAAAVEPLVRERFGGGRLLWVAALAGGFVGGLGVPLLAASSGAGPEPPASFVASNIAAEPGTPADPVAAAGPAEPLVRRSSFAERRSFAERLSMAGTRAVSAIWNAPAIGRVAASVRDAVARSTARLDGAAAVAWPLASLVLLGALTVSVLRLRRLRRAGRVRRLPGLDVVHHPTRGPAAAGVVRPWVLLPEWSAALPRRQRRLLLRHELEHVRGRDPLLKLAGALIVTAMPWNPAAWWAVRRLYQALEIDCDHRVLARSGGAGSAGHYARFLLDVAGGSHLPACATGAAHLTGNLERRLLAMTTPQRTEGHRRLLRALLAVTALALMVVVRAPAAPIFGQSAVQPANPATDAAVTDVAGMDVAGRDVAAMDVAGRDVAATGGVGGTVVDHGGQPIVGAEVRVADATVGTVSDREGRFLIPRLEPGTYRLLVSAQGYRSEAVTDVRIVSGQRAQVTITLSRMGQPPVPAVHHAPVPQPPLERPAPPALQPYAAPALQAGVPWPSRPVAAPAPPQPYAAPVPEAGVAWPSRPVAAPPVPEGGIPWPRPAAPPAVREIGVTQASPPHPPPPPAEVRVPQTPAPQAPPPPAEVPAGRAPVSGAAVAEDGSISGSVVDHTGESVAGVLIRMGDGDVGTVTDRSGRFLIPYLAPGTYRLQVSVPGYRSQDVSDVLVAAGHRTELTVVLSRTGEPHVPATRQDPSPHRPAGGVAQPAPAGRPRAVRGDIAEAGSLLGTVVNQAGDPIPAVQVRVADAQLGTVTDTEGRFLLPRLQEGNYRLQISAPGYASRTLDDVRIVPLERIVVFVTLDRQPPDEQ